MNATLARRFVAAPLLASLCALAACAQQQSPVEAAGNGHAQSGPDQQGEPSLHAPFDRLLKNRVRDGMVEYAEIRKHDSGTLKSYLDALAAADVKKLAKRQQFAFYVNLYNATMIQAVLEHTEKDRNWKPSANEFAVFKEKRVRLKTGTVTLDHLENEILRPRFKDHRVHVALVCGARSCPPLISRAYEAKELDATLDANFKAFLRDGVRNRVDRAAKKVHLSKLFEWFAADFGGEQGVRKLLKAEFGDAVSRYDIAYLEYSWELNAQRKKR